jgi:hypothetical protein
MTEMTEIWAVSRESGLCGDAFVHWGVGEGGIPRN